MKCRITFQGGHGMHEDASDQYASILVDVPDDIAHMCHEYGASLSHVVSTEWINDFESSKYSEFAHDFKYKGFDIYWDCNKKRYWMDYEGIPLEYKSASDVVKDIDKLEEGEEHGNVAVGRE